MTKLYITRKQDIYEEEKNIIDRVYETVSSFFHLLYNHTIKALKDHKYKKNIETLIKNNKKI